MAAQALETLIVRLTGDAARYERMLKGAVARTKAAAAKITSLGKRISLAITAPLAVIEGLSVKAFANFDKAIIEAGSIMQNVTQDEMKKMRQAALDLAVTATTGPLELAETLKILASSGMNAAQAIEALAAVETFATAGLMETAQATQFLIAAQGALQLRSEDAAQNMLNLVRVADAITMANNLAEGGVEEFSKALTTQAATSLANFNKDVEEGMALLALYAQAGISGERAGSLLSRMMRLLSQSSRDAAEAHKRLGFRVFDAEGKMRNFADIAENLEQIMAGMSTEMKSVTLDTLGFAARVQNAIFPMIGMSKQLRDFEAAIRAGGGETQRVGDFVMTAFGNQAMVLKNQIHVLAIEIGGHLVPFVKAIGGGIRNMLAAWRALNDVSKRSIVLIGIAAALIGPALIVLGVLIGSLAKVIGLVILPFTILSTVIGVVGAALSIVGGVITAVFGIIAGATTILGVFNLALLAVGGGLVFVAVKSAVAAIAAIDFGKIFSNIGETIRIVWGGIKDAIAAGDLPTALKIAGLGMRAVWKEVMVALHLAWGKFLSELVRGTIEVISELDFFFGAAERKRLALLNVGLIRFDSHIKASLAKVEANRLREELDREIAKLAEAAAVAEAVSAVADFAQGMFDFPVPGDQQKIDQMIAGLGDAKKEAKGLRMELQGIPAALFGSAEALARVTAFREANRPGAARPGAPGVPVAAGGVPRRDPDMEQVVQVLKDIRNIGREQLKRPAVQVGAAGLA